MQRCTTRSLCATTRRGLLLTVTAAALLVAGCTPPTPPVWLSADLDDCQKGIESEAAKLDKKIFGALKKCKDLYRKSLLAGDPLTDAATGCDTALGKVLTFPDPLGKSAMAKAKAKLDDFADLLDTTPKCSAESLVALGHGPVQTFGDLWARLVMVQRLKQAIEGQVAIVGDTAEIFAQLSGAGCTRCASISSLPCRRATCSLGGSTDVYSVQFASAFAVPVSSLSFDACSYPDILGTDLGVYAGLRQPLVPAGALTGVTTCLRLSGARGYIIGSGSSLPSVDIETCQDHVADDGDECPAALGVGSLCPSVQADTQHPVDNGGACVAFSSGPSVVGESFAMVSGELRRTCDGVICGGDTRGPDLLPCTEDDTSTVYRFGFPVTTEGAETQMLDADATDGNVITLGGGIAGTTMGISDSTKRFTGTWVAAFPGLHTIDGTPDFDDALYLTLECN